MTTRPLQVLAAVLTGLLPLQPPAAALAASARRDPTQLEGKVVVMRGNQMPGIRTAPQAPAAGAVVLAVSGLVAPLKSGQPFLPAGALKAPVLAKTRCDAQGHFRLILSRGSQAAGQGIPQQVTLLLLVPGGYWLNRFDGQGRFASLSLPLPADHPPIVLIDDRHALR